MTEEKRKWERRTIPIRLAERIMKDAGAEQASYSGAFALSEILENIGEEIVEHAISITNSEPHRYLGAKRVQGRHIKLAYKLWRKQI